MAINEVEQRTIITYLQVDYLLVWIEAFLIDRKAQNMSKGTLGFYRCKLKNFSDFCEGKAVKNILQITTSLLREYLLEFETKGHNPGGCHSA
jgi:integrase/recombinase XerD